MLTTNDLASHFGVHVATIYRWRENGVLPAPLMLSKTTVRWREIDIERFEAWLMARAEAEKAGRDPDGILVPDYSLPVTTDSNSMSRERLAASFEEPSSMQSYIETLGDEMTKLAAEAAILASKSGPGQLSQASIERLRKSLPTAVKQWLLDELPPSNAARLEELLHV